MVVSKWMVRRQEAAWMRCWSDGTQLVKYSAKNKEEKNVGRAMKKAKALLQEEK